MLDLLIALLRRWVRPTVLDNEPLGAECGTVCYVLQRPSSLDLAALELAAARIDAPSARAPLELAGNDNTQSPRSVFALTRHAGWLRQRSTPRGDSRALHACIQAAIDGRDVTLVPVSVFWGRAPDREGSLWRLLLSERWTAVGLIGNSDRDDNTYAEAVPSMTSAMASALKRSTKTPTMVTAFWASP